MNKTLEDFHPIQQGTQCSFAKAAKLWGGCDGLYDSPSTADRNAATLTELVRRSTIAGEALDGFCIALPGDGGPEILGHRARSVLTSLSDRDSAKENMMRKAYIGQRGWRFRLSGTDFFVTIFAPCYPSTSSRFSFGTPSAFVLLQPEVSFYRHKLSADSPVTADPPKTIRGRTRLAFRNAGRSYHIPDTIHYPLAEHIVKPLRDDGKAIVRWSTDDAIK
uniref:Uncharacterized protein n=1 Tax=Amphora coffeiformis TaxID=265554 RepID=A0A7S3KXU1_9STRA|mmetsp:Transcript_2282/g.4931  ORF Transcript_2282/g.4931 Transcript_2282/m.4931 type:complete len:220 (-) Transcript_2282:194-853(-)